MAGIRQADRGKRRDRRRENPSDRLSQIGYRRFEVRTLINLPTSYIANHSMIRFPKRTFIPRHVWVKLGIERFGGEVDDDN